MPDDAPRRRAWVAQPPHDEATLRRETGHGWDEWVDLIVAGPGREAGHTAIAAWLRDECEVDPWWAQGITVGAERILGLRLPGQMPDGTFTIARSKSVDLDIDTLRACWESDTARVALLEDLVTERVSRPGVKVPKFALSRGDELLGVLSLSMESRSGRVHLVLTHAQLPDSDAAEQWKTRWGSWLQRLPGLLAAA